MDVIIHACPIIIKTLLVKEAPSRGTSCYHQHMSGKWGLAQEGWSLRKIILLQIILFTCPEFLYTTFLFS